MFILKNLSPRLFVLVLIFLFVFAFNAQLFARQQDVNQPEDFFEMPLEELMDVEIESPATLTKTKQQFVPATVTTITKQDIQRSGARSLYELLEARVPNFQMIFHIAKLRHLGLRGIISNRDDKFLLLVNGRVMNEKTDFGVMTERDLPMLSDIHHIDVVRGPGSALYGPGALAMVINIVTEDATTFQGTQVTGRLGAIEEFYSGEFKYGKKFKDDSGIFIYGGATKYPGADLDYSPIVPGGTHTFSGITHTAGDEIDMWFNNFNESFRGLGKYKFHGQYTKGGLNIWARYTSGGEYIDFIRIKKKKLWPHEGEGYRQGTIYVGYDHSFSDNFSIKTAFSYDRTEVETRDGVYRIKSFREEEYYSKVVANLTPNESHSLAVGGEWSHELFGRRHSNDRGKAVMYLLPYNSRKTFDEATKMPHWHTDLKSLFGEYQWKINEQFTTFLGGRIDDHTFTDTMFSPRAALIYTPSKKDTLKFMFSRSARTNTATEMKKGYDANKEDSDTETLKAFEVRYEKQHTNKVWLAGGFFYHWHDIIGWSNTSQGTALLGKMKTYGFEIEASYKTDKTRISISHGYVKLVDLSLRPGEIESQFSAEPMGFGDDLANWDNHITKLIINHDLDTNWRLDSSLLFYWGSPGGKDFAEYQNSLGSTARFYELGFEAPFRPSIYLSVGLEHNINDNLTFRVDGYNLLGIFDKDLNKRRVGFNDNYPGEYRIQPPAIGVSLTYRF